MSRNPQIKPDSLQVKAEGEPLSKPEAEKILCPHCLKTATNGIKCQGICVADSDY